MPGDESRAHPGRDSSSWTNAIGWTLLIQLLLFTGAWWWQVALDPVLPEQPAVEVALDLRSGETLLGRPPTPERVIEPDPEEQVEAERPAEPIVPLDPRPLPLSPGELPRVGAPITRRPELPRVAAAPDEDLVPPVASPPPSLPAGLAKITPRRPAPRGDLLRPRRGGGPVGRALPPLPEVEAVAETQAAASGMLLEGPAAHRQIVRRVVPRFPDAARRSERVRLRFLVRTDGSVGEVVPETRVEPVFEEAAIDALRQWRFAAQAGRQDRGTITFVFALLPASVP